MTLRDKIVQEIREHGPIAFSRYMEMCLYDPELGFYSQTAERFGKAGDFYTSSDVHAVFGRLLARQFEEMWRVLGSPPQIEILELGPGRGLFARDVLDWSEKKFPEFFRAVRYTLVERSPTLQQRLGITLDRHFTVGKVSMACIGEGKGTTAVMPAEPALARELSPEVPVIIFANEFFDALPVEILTVRGELRITETGGRFTESWVPPSSDTLDFLDRFGVRPESGERIEVPLLAQQHMSAIANTVGLGFVVAIDYGYTRAEQLAGRHRGTLMTYRQHSAGANPYEAPGEQDITAHVNFTALEVAARQHGMRVEPLLTQSQFLMGIGERNQFADAFVDCRLPQEHAKVALQLKHLVTPAGMGETFHVLLASKSVPVELVARLSGLSFGSRRT